MSVVLSPTAIFIVVLCQGLKLGLTVIPAQAGIHIAALT
jgi:hypothetical protein